MEKLNSSTRIDLPVSPRIEDASLFNELLAAYSGVRALHSATSNFFPDTDSAPETFDPEQTIGLYTIGARAKVLLPAGENILAGRFLETYLLSGVLSVRHTRCSVARGVSWHSIGISLENVSAGQKAQVYIFPAMIPGFSSLTPGNPYFFYDDGQFVDSTIVYPVGGASTTIVRSCGRAITDKIMLINSFSGYSNV